MIFVTVGTTTEEFYRLVYKADEIAKKLQEEVIIQKGCTKYVPKYAKHFDFVEPYAIENYIRAARLMITHGGEGSIMLALKHKKLTIVVPRLFEFHEHINSHQLDLVNELEKQNKILVVRKIKNLENVIKQANKLQLKTQEENKESKIIKIIQEYLDNLELAEKLCKNLK